MGVYIKGMEMPKSCDDCDFMYTVCPYADRICLFASDIKESCKRADDCPLIEVPKHGNLIDRDMVLEKAWDVETFVDAVRFAPTIIPASTADIEREAAIRAIDVPNICHGIIAPLQEILCDVPAADVQPVRHGRWIAYQQGRWIYAKCSGCETVHDVKSPYCPNCGAKMDGGKT